MRGPTPDCLSCKLFHEKSDPQRPTCAAFEGGIPRDIYFDGAPHRQPRPGDGGMVFSPRPNPADRPPLKGL